MTRKNPETSIQAYNRIMSCDAKETAYKKIIQALEVIGEGNYEAIALQAKETESRIWKRLGECRSMGLIFDTGKRIVTKNGSNSMVYALFTQKEKHSQVPKPEKIPKGKGIIDYSKAIRRVSKIVQQASLF